MDNGLFRQGASPVGRRMQESRYYNVKGYINFTQNQL